MTFKTTSIALAMALVTASAAPVNAADPYLGAEKMEESSHAYLGEGLTTTPHIRLRKTGHPTSDDLAGKEYIFVNGEASEGVDKVGGNYVKFTDTKTLEFHSYCCPQLDNAPITKANYISFKIASGVYFVTFIEQRSKWREQQLVAFILDQNKMTFTDSFAEDDFGNGELYWMLVQGALVDMTPKKK